MLASRPNNAAKNYWIYSFRHCLDSNHDPFDYQAAAMTTIPWFTNASIENKGINTTFSPVNISMRLTVRQCDRPKVERQFVHWIQTRKICFIIFAWARTWTINLQISRPFLWPLYHQVLTFHWQPTHTEKCRRSNPRFPCNGPPRPGSGRGSDIMNCLVYNPLENGIMNIKFWPVKEVVWSYAAVKIRWLWKPPPGIEPWSSGLAGRCFNHYTMMYRKMRNSRFTGRNSDHYTMILFDVISVISWRYWPL